MHILFIDNVHPTLKKELEKLNYICDTAYNKSKSQIERIIRNYDGIVIRSRLIIDKQFIDKANKLQFIARAGSGLENIDREYAKLKHVKCFNAGEGNSQAVAEHALGMLLSLMNNLNKSDNEVRNGKWKREENRGVELYGKTIGIIGMGNTGSAFYKLLKGFNLKTLTYDKYLKKYSNDNIMESIYSEADIISLHIPLTKETTYLIDDDFINKCKKRIYLVNTSRGRCVNTKSIIAGLKNNKIKGICLDVLEHEESSFEKLSAGKSLQELNYLKQSRRSILSPHIAGWTKESNIKIATILLNKIITYVPE